MADEEEIQKDENSAKGGYRPVKEGYKPVEGNLDPNNPPTGGSGISNIPGTINREQQEETNSDESTSEN